jgi:hypothetical protein
MIWTEEMLEAAALLGFDPKNPKHRALVEEAKERASARPRGRPKGSGVSDDDLAVFALMIDRLKPALNATNDKEALKRIVVRIGGRVLSAEKMMYFTEAEDDFVRQTAPAQYRPPPRVTPIQIYWTTRPVLPADCKAAPEMIDCWLAVDTLRNMLVRGRQVVRERGLTQENLKMATARTTHKPHE